MIERFNDVEVRGTGLVLSSMFEQIKKMHAVDPDMAGELAISAIELVLTGQISSDDAMIDMMLAPARVINNNNVQKYELRKEGSKNKKIKEMKLEEIADMFKNGVKQREIAERLNLSQQTVSYRIGVIRTQYPELLQDVRQETAILDESPAQTFYKQSESLPKNLQTKVDVYQNTKIQKDEKPVFLQEGDLFVKSEVDKDDLWSKF